jgi:hypothetical protein
MPRLAHSSRFYHPHKNEWAVQIMKLLIMKFSPLPCYLVPLRPKYSPQHPRLRSSLSVSDQVGGTSYRPYKKGKKTELVTYCVGTAFWNTLLKER